MEFSGKTKIKEIAEMLSKSNSTVVSSIAAHSEKMKSSVTSILEQCEDLLVQFDSCKCTCKKFEPKFKEICVKVIQLYRDHEKNIDSLNESIVNSSIDLSTSGTNFDNISNIKTEPESEVDLNQTYVVYETTSDDENETKNTVKILRKKDVSISAKDHERQVKLTKTEQEILNLNLEIEELDYIISNTKSTKLSDEFIQIRNKLSISLNEKLEYVKKYKFFKKEEVSSKSILNQRDVSSMKNNLSNFRVVNKTTKVLRSETFSITKEKYKNSPINSPKKCACKTACISRFCACYKNGIACSVKTCNCNATLCQNKNKKEVKRSKSVRDSSIGSYLMDPDRSKRLKYSLRSK